jgi:hypothetical protein
LAYREIGHEFFIYSPSSFHRPWSSSRHSTLNDLWLIPSSYISGVMACFVAITQSTGIRRWNVLQATFSDRIAMTPCLERRTTTTYQWE